MKTTSYNIYSNKGFIGFVAIGDNGQFLHGHLSIYEAIPFRNGYHLALDTTKQGAFQLSTPDLDIIRDLIQKAIPTLRTNGLTYTAIDISGQTQTI